MKKYALLALLLCLALCLPALASAEETAAKPLMDIVWVVDCTGSMSNILKTVNNNLDEFAAQLTDFDVQYGLVGFGDEVISPPEPTVIMRWNGSEWTDKISDVQKSMVIGGEGGLPKYYGGDSAETSTLAITMAANQYAWRDGAIRQIILVTDINPKEVKDKVPDVVTTGDLCKSKDITVNLVDCGYASGYDEILNRTNGKKVSTSTSQMEQLAQWVNNAPVVITQPEDQYVHEGDNALFMATSINGKIIRFNWYYKLVGSDKEKAGMGGAARSTEPRDYPQHKQYSVRKNVDDGAVFYCRFTNTDTGDTRSIDTRKATLHVASAFDITSQPQNVTTDAGQTATFTVVATGDGLTYQWQKQSGEDWVDLSGKTAATLSIPATLADDGSVYRCVVKDAISDKQPGGYTLTSNSATLTVVAAPAITGHPQDVTTEAGKKATFTVEATGTGLTYQWQQQNGSGWADLSGETDKTLTVPATTENSGSVYRSQVTSSYGTVLTSRSAALTVDGAPVITSHPLNVTTEAGKKATFTVEATGTGLTYQWQQQNGDDWDDLSGETGTSLTVLAATENSGSVYRCQVTSSYGTVVASQSAALTVLSAPAIAQQPESVIVMEGEDASITVDATGDGLKYQWQVYRSGVWMDCIGEESPTLTLSGVTLADDGLAYRCVITSSYGTKVTSDAVTLTVLAKVESPQTGDASRPLLWLTLLGASLLGMVMLRRRRA